jgi:hypothetical protein
VPVTKDTNRKTTKTTTWLGSLTVKLRTGGTKKKSKHKTPRIDANNEGPSPQKTPLMSTGKRKISAMFTRSNKGTSSLPMTVVASTVRKLHA